MGMAGDGAALLTIREAAKHLRVHRKTLERWIRQGELPVIRLNSRTFRLRQTELEAWIEQRVGQARAVGE
jgi:excisionase family DNA binding protein